MQFDDKKRVLLWSSSLTSSHTNLISKRKETTERVRKENRKGDINANEERNTEEEQLLSSDLDFEYFLSADSVS